MAYRFETNQQGKTELVIDGWEKGIAPSPHAGIANMQKVNISTEMKEVMCSFGRTRQSQSSGTGTLTQVNTNTVSISGITLKVGSWISITDAGTTGLSGNYYYVSDGKLSATFAQDNSTIVTGITSGTATFSVYPMGKPLEGTSETYLSSGTTYYRYYVLDDLGQIWVHDTKSLSGVDTPLWFLYRLPISLNGQTPSGLAVLNGWLTFCLDNKVYWESTSILGTTSFQQTSNIELTTYTNHKTLLGHQGKLYWCDGNFVASIFPNSSILSGAANLQSYCSYTASTVTGTASLIGGSYPNSISLGARVPVVFFCRSSGALPTALTVDTTYSNVISLSITYYIEWQDSGSTFKVYAALTGGAALDIETGASGTQFFNTFSPLSLNATSITDYVYTAQRLNLPFYEKAQCLAELGNTVLIGGSSNTIYPWDQVSSLPSSIIPLPESNVVNILTVNSVALVFAGSKGNIYVTNGSSASLALTVPDYCAGIAGTPASYIDPYFTWGGAAFIRGRVYFSVLDQTSAKTGNCGGIWSFIPVQAGISSDVGTALRLENQNSYATYNGVATVILPAVTQTVVGTQYWSGWYSSISGPTYGIDFTDTVSTATFALETDLIPTGTFLNKVTFANVEYKLASPLASGESVAISYRQNGTDSYASMGTAQTESATGISGYFPVNFQQGQWLQLYVVGTSLASSSSSFVRLKEIRVRFV